MNGKTTPPPSPRLDPGATRSRTATATGAGPAPVEGDDNDLVNEGGLLCALLDAARAISAEVEARAGDAHMTVAQARLARHFASSDPGVPMTELAARSGMTAPAVTQMLRRMTQKGLVHRSGNPLDSRSVIVRLTRTGLREFRAISARLSSIDRELGRRAGVSPERLSRILSRLPPPSAR